MKELSEHSVLRPTGQDHLPLGQKNSLRRSRCFRQANQQAVHITPQPDEAVAGSASDTMAEAEHMLRRDFPEDEKALFNQLLARAAENIK
ncbi:MAG: hypothetical protein ACLTZH_11550 [Subdoligranulum sp.]